MKKIELTDKEILDIADYLDIVLDNLFKSVNEYSNQHSKDVNNILKLKSKLLTQGYSNSIKKRNELTIELNLDDTDFNLKLEAVKKSLRELGKKLSGI